MQRNFAPANNLGQTEEWKRGKMKYYIETIFQPPERITYPNFASGSNNRRFSSEDEQCGEYVVLDMKSVFDQISLLVKCKICAGDVVFSRAQINGLGFKLVVLCQNCGEMARIDSSKIIGPTSNDYEINARNEQACQFLAGLSSSNVPPNTLNQPIMNSQGQYYSNPQTRQIPGNDLRHVDTSSMQYQQNMQAYYPQQEWHNHSVFGSSQASNLPGLPLPQVESWKAGSGNHVEVPLMKVERGDEEDESDAEDEDDDDDSEGPQQMGSFPNTHEVDQLVDNKPAADGSLKGRRRAVKKQRAEGQRLTSDTPLPNFSSYVLAELAKPAPKMSVVLPPCKAHIIAVTGDEYPTKKEYEVFSLQMILSFPSLKDPDTDHGFERFKKSLSASFRSRRSYENNIKPNRISKRSFDWRPQSNSSSSDFNASLVTEGDQSKDLSLLQPSTSSSKMDRLDDDEHSQDVEQSFGDSDSETSGSTSQHNDRPRKRRKAVKKVRGEGQSLTSETPLPDFSVDVLNELAKPIPRMSVVLPSCKAHIIAVTGDEYPTKKEYEIFSLKMVMAFPSLRDPDTEYGFERFKKSLSSSFRARRSYEKNIKPCKMSKRALNALAMDQMPPIDNIVHRSLQPPAHDEEMRTADEELSKTDCTAEPDKARYLIEKSFNFRRKIASAHGFDDQTFLHSYQHYSNCDMLLYEYSLIVTVGINDLRDNFEEGLLVLSKMLWDTSHFSNIDDELRKIQVLVQLQEYFLNQKHMRLDPNAKPLFVIKDEMAAFNDGDNSFRNTLVPCALVLIQGGCISKLLITHKDRIVMEKYGATAFDTCSSLLAFFFILNVKYPPVYLDNLKALERLLNKKLSLAALQTTISSPYSNYVKLYDAKLKECLPLMKTSVSHNQQR